MAGVAVFPINISAAFSAQIDIFELLSSSTQPLDLLGWEIMQTTEVGDAQEEVLTLVLKRITGAPTSGSGGGTPTGRSTVPGGTVGATLETGNTTKLTGGTSEELSRFGWQLRQAHLYQPTPDEIITIAPATRLVLELATTPADQIGGIVGRLIIAELL